MKDYDLLMRSAIQRNLNLSVPFYLMSCYAYYEEDSPILSDTAHDWLAQEMTEKWLWIKHPDKHYISLDDVAAQTFLGSYPNRAIQALKQLRTTKP